MFLQHFTESQLRKQFPWHGQLTYRHYDFDFRALGVCYDFSPVNVKCSDPTHTATAEW